MGIERARLNGARAGFSLAEMVVVVLILGAGLLVMGISTGYVLTQVRSAELRNERLSAVRQATETLRGTEWSALERACEGGPFAIGEYAVACSVSVRPNAKRVQIVSEGPDYDGGRVVQAADTTILSLAAPLTGT